MVGRPSARKKPGSRGTGARALTPTGSMVSRLGIGACSNTNAGIPRLRAALASADPRLRSPFHTNTAFGRAAASVARRPAYLAAIRATDSWRLIPVSGLRPTMARRRSPTRSASSAASTPCSRPLKLSGLEIRNLCRSPSAALKARKIGTAISGEQEGEDHRRLAAGFPAARRDHAH